VIVQDAWNRGQSLTLHGWIYGLKDGLIKDLGIKVERLEQVPPQFRFQTQGSKLNARAEPPEHH
jgi:hypothetical protein